MRESEWLTCDDPQKILTWVREGWTEGTRVPLLYPGVTMRGLNRKLRLFACACCRQVWHLLTDERSRKAVEVAERYADGEATEAERHESERQAHNATPYPLDDPGSAVALSAHYAVWPAAGYGAEQIVKMFQDQHPFQAALLRDIVGNPFRPSRPREWWLTPIVLALARAAYEDRSWRECVRCQSETPGWRLGLGMEPPLIKCHVCHGTGRIEDGSLDPDRLTILADALEEAGCGNEDMLTHLRGPGPHVRGCWVVDCLLGKENGHD